MGRVTEPNRSRVWILAGPRDAFKIKSQDLVFDTLERLLWDHANKVCSLLPDPVVLGRLGYSARIVAIVTRPLACLCSVTPRKYVQYVTSFYNWSVFFAMAMHT